MRRFVSVIGFVCLFLFNAGTSYAAHEIRVEENDHHAFVVRAEIAGVSAPFVVDTGAAPVAITAELAKRLHLKALDKFIGMGAGGKILSYRVVIPEIRVGDIVIKNVEAAIVPSLPSNLLGMTFLERLQSIHMEGHTLILKQ